MDARGRTALHHAISVRGNDGVATALLAAGADPHVADGAGLTPVAMALDETFTTGRPQVRSV
eukprot:SAG11_NODE_2306_length_3546_cov_2.802147_4_plen_62_part_00